MLWFLLCVRLTGAMSVAEQNADDTSSVCGGLFEPIPHEEMPFYWPSECQRCHLYATNDTHAADCRCSPESFSCPLRYPPAGVKPSLKMRLKGTPDGVSHLRHLVSALEGRKILWVGDSITGQFRYFFKRRAKHLEIPETFLGDHRDCEFKNRNTTCLHRLVGPNLYDYMKDEGNRSKWDIWAETGRKMLLKAAAEQGPLGVIFIFNAGLHVPSGQTLAMNLPFEDTYRRILHESFEVLREIGKMSPQTNVPIFMETATQHFPKEQGDHFFPPLVAGTEKNPATTQFFSPQPANSLESTGYACTPLPCSRGAPPVNNERTNRGLSSKRWKTWRNRILAEVAPDYPEVFVAPLGDLTAELSDIHSLLYSNQVYTSECTHWCYSPGLVEGAAKFVLDAVLAHGTKSMP